MDSNWAITILTGVLVIITGWYAYSTHRYVKLFDKDRKRKVIAEVAGRVILPIFDQLIDEKEKLETDKYLSRIYIDPTTQDLVVVLFEDRYVEHESIYSHFEDDFSKIILLTKDKFLENRLPRIRELSQMYSENLIKLKKAIKELTDEIPDEFIAYLEELLAKSDSKIWSRFKDDPKEFVLYFVRDILTKVEQHSSSIIYSEFWNKHGREIINNFSKIDSMKKKVGQIEQIKQEAIEIAQQLLAELKELMKEWRVRYDLTETEARMYRVQ